MAEVPDFKKYIQRVSGDMGAPEEANWTTLYEGTGGASPTYDLGSDEFHSTDWAPTSEEGATFGCWMRVSGSVMWLMVANMYVTVPDTTQPFLSAASFNEWPEGAEIEFDSSVVAPFYVELDNKVGTIVVESRGHGLSLAQNQGVAAGDGFGAFGCFSVFSFPLSLYSGVQ
jgi:hypothetical protein